MGTPTHSATPLDMEGLEGVARFLNSNNGTPGSSFCLLH
jgi:hypothetical protein